MKKIIIGLLFFASYSGISQNLRYGTIIGANVYDLEIEGPIQAGTGWSYFNFGGFVDYKLNNRFGLKGHLIYTNTQETDYYYYSRTSDYYKNGPMFSTAKLKTLQMHTLGKFDVRRYYNKGFYLLGGFKTTFVLDAKTNENVDLKDFYEKVNFGGMFGFGVTFLKNFSFETVVDYSLTSTVVDSDKTKNLGCYGNLLFNVEPLFNKKK